MSSISFAILTVSDTCSAGKAVDKSGQQLEQLLSDGSLIPGAEVAARSCVADDLKDIQRALVSWCSSNINVILTTGGTGFAPRDVTPEATRQILQKETPGLTMAMFKYGLEVAFPYAMLSRGVCGIRERTLIINLPGSVKGAQESLVSVAPCIPHAVALLRDDMTEVTSTHSALHAVGPLHITSSNVGIQKNANNHHHCHYHRGDDNTQSQVNAQNVAGRVRSSPYPMIDVPIAQSEVLSAATVLGSEIVFYRNALGRILAQDVYAKDPLPPFPASIKDGYAVIASDGSGKRAVLGSSAAGQVPSGAPLQPGQCVRITTGAAVPDGADSVVQVEDTELVRASPDNNEEEEINILKAPIVGEDIRPLGSDIEAGQLVLKTGSLLGPAELGLLATVGVTKIAVKKIPTVALLSTGNELQDPKDDEPLKPGHIRDSNKTTLLALLETQSCKAVDIGIAVDEPQALLMALKKGFSCADIVVTTGGVSMGERDLLKRILTTDLNATIHFGRIAMKPGKPTTFATCQFNGEKKLIFGLPGNPVSATVTSHLFLLPALRKMCGHPSPLPTVVKAKLNEDVSLDPRPEYHRAILRWDSGEPIPVAVSTGNQISSRLLSCHSSNCLLVFPSITDNRLVLEKGSVVDALLLREL